MRPKWLKQSLAHKICTLYFPFFGVFFASNGYMNIFICLKQFQKNLDLSSETSVFLECEYILLDI